MNIVHITKFLPSYYGGIELVSRLFVDAGLGFAGKVRTVGVDPKKGSISTSSDREEWIAVKSIANLGTIPIAPGVFVLRDVLRDAQIVHIHLPNPLAELGLLHYLNHTSPDDRARLVPIVHAGINRWPNFGRFWLGTFQRQLLKKSHKIILASRQLADLLPTVREMNDKVVVLPFPSRRYGTGPLKNEKGSDSVVRLLALGRLVGYKGYDRLIQAVSNLPGNWHLTIAGHGPKKAELDEQISRLNLENKVTIQYEVSDSQKHALFQQCDIFVQPSVSEAECYGMSVVEAFAYGKPVVTSNLQTGLAFLARKGKCGAVVRVGAIGELTQAISHLIENKQERVRIGEENLKFWEENLKFEVFQERYKNLCTGLLSDSSHRIAS